MGAACCTNGTPGKGGCCRSAAGAEESGESAALIAQEDVCGGGGDDLKDLRREANRVDSLRAADAAAGPPSAVDSVQAALHAAEARALATKQMQLSPASGVAPYVAVPIAVAGVYQSPQGNLGSSGGSAESDAQRTEKKRGTSPSAMQFEVSWDGKGYVGKSDSPSTGGGAAVTGMDMNGMTGIEEGSSEEEDEPQVKVGSANMPVTKSLITESGFEVGSNGSGQVGATPEQAKPVKKRRAWSLCGRGK